MIQYVSCVLSRGNLDTIQFSSLDAGSREVKFSRLPFLPLIPHLKKGRSMAQEVEVDGEGAIVLTENLVKLASGQFDVALPQTLVLSHLQISRLMAPVLEKCVSITILDVSYNKLRTTKGIAALSNSLVQLDLRFNALTALDEVAALRNLQILRLQGNEIREQTEIANLADLKSLRALLLREKDGTAANPVCSQSNYVPLMNSWFPNVRCIDGHYFCKEDMNPKKIDLDQEEEYTLPKSIPWITEENLKTALYDPNKVGVAQEKNFRAVLQDAKTMLK